MARLTVLLPELRRAGAQVPRSPWTDERGRRVAAVPLLASWLARGDRLTDLKPGRETALRSVFAFSGTALPAAALTRSIDATDAAGTSWLRADPCHVFVDAVAVRMLAWSNLGLSAEESNELARALRPLFGDAGFPLEAATPERWYLRCPRGARLPQFTDPADVLGADLLPHFPHGENERQWRHLLNEAQVILHNHPVNVLRVQRGQLAANSVWFWGAGELPDLVRTSFTRVATSEALLGALARLAKVASVPANPDAFFHFDAKDDLLLDLGAGVVRDEWYAPLHEALRKRQLSELELRFESGEVVLWKHWHRWRFWRRVPVGAS